jgi:Polysaccharide deacetylase
MLGLGQQKQPVTSPSRRLKRFREKCGRFSRPEALQYESQRSLRHFATAGKILGLRAAASVLVLLAIVQTAVAACDANDRTRLGVTRIVEIDTSTGPVLGHMTKLPHERQFLAPGEVVLTFDDGPMPWITRAILATLAQHCTRATFFSVGKMAVAYPGVVREVLAHGHTLGTHTWSHPLNLKRLPLDQATAEMERGFAAVAVAAGQPIAPFFRFPGLSVVPQWSPTLRRGTWHHSPSMSSPTTATSTTSRA